MLKLICEKIIAIQYFITYPLILSILHNITLIVNMLYINFGELYNSEAANMWNMLKDYIRFVIFLKIITRKDKKKPANVHIVPHKSDNKIKREQYSYIAPA